MFGQSVILVCPAEYGGTSYIPAVRNTQHKISDMDFYVNVVLNFTDFASLPFFSLWFLTFALRGGFCFSSLLFFTTSKAARAFSTACQFMFPPFRPCKVA